MAMKWINFKEDVTEEFMVSLSNEISVLSRVEGDFIAKAFYSFMKENSLFIMMEYIEGGDLRDLLADLGYLTFEEA